MTHLITSRTDWSESLLQEIYSHIEDIGVNDLKLDVYPNQIEIISAEQMLDAYSSVGLPIMYNHWSFGKEFQNNWTKYQNGQMGLAYEIVLNTNPCISYLMEENSAVMQTLVIAHAAFGHNFVFKNNYLFKDWTSAGSIIDYMIFAKKYIATCEEKYGTAEVESVLDSCHALSKHGVDKSKRKHKPHLNDEQQLLDDLKKDDDRQKNIDIVQMRTAIDKGSSVEDKLDLDLVGDEENLMYFIYKNSPNLPTWKREIMRIVHKTNQYFAPQSQTKTLNEGMATFTHYYIMNELENRGLISPDAQLAWMHSHSGVVYQPTFNSKHYSGFNPYALGFGIFKEIRRVCEEPTKEDEAWFPSMVGTDWRTAVKHAASDYRDESFIEQFLTPKLIRELNLFSLEIGDKNGTVSEISDDMGYRKIRQDLARSYNMINHVPEITVHSAKMSGNRDLFLCYNGFNGKTLNDKMTKKTLRHVNNLWGYDVGLLNKGDDGNVLASVMWSIHK